jgi:hypothetical protein
MATTYQGDSRPLGGGALLQARAVLDSLTLTDLTHGDGDES